jgi:hypothetical protein
VAVGDGVGDGVRVGVEVVVGVEEGTKVEEGGGIDSEVGVEGVSEVQASIAASRAKSVIGCDIFEKAGIGISLLESSCRI